MLCVEPGKKIALARRYHTPALSQRELAQQLGVDTSTVGRWESTDDIPKDRIPSLTSKLNVTETWLFNGDDSLPTQGRLVPVHEPPNFIAKSPETATRLERQAIAGDLLAVPVWRGVAAGSVEECEFVESDEPEFKEIDAFYTAGHRGPHVICVASGLSMAPRIGRGERALVRIDPDVPPGRLVVARSPDNRNYIKKLVKTGPRSLELHSLNEDFPPIPFDDGWTVKGGVTIIWHDYEPGKPNLEWDEGRFLKA
jgi:phage repressor protein C with HTH and peptisase S24 domain